MFLHQTNNWTKAGYLTSIQRSLELHLSHPTAKLFSPQESVLCKRFRFTVGFGKSNHAKKLAKLSSPHGTAAIACVTPHHGCMVHKYVNVSYISFTQFYIWLQLESLDHTTHRWSGYWKRWYPPIDCYLVGPPETLKIPDLRVFNKVLDCTILDCNPRVTFSPFQYGTGSLLGILP